MDLSGFFTGSWFSSSISSMPDTLLPALISAIVTLALVLAFAPMLGFRFSPGDAQVDDEPATSDFLVNGSQVKALTDPARRLLEGFSPATSRLTALIEYLSPECPTIQKDIEALVLHGAGFRHHCPSKSGAPFEILGQPRGSTALLSLRPASEDAQALRDSQSALASALEETRFLRDVLDRAPVIAWNIAADGQVIWANATYLDRFKAPTGGLPDHRIPDAFGHVIEEVPLTARAGGLRRRVAVPARKDEEAHWFEVSQTQSPDGSTLSFALDADDLVAAESSLRRFVETLTETFAHLPIGLAVFDKNRRLGLFNPALTDLVKIDAVWLAGRPSLRDFLERLRETRQMPEQKDFASFRRKLTELEEGAREGTYEENWVLPSGKILRVTGRPHPQGALAFLFEDISTAIQLERRYRSELELSQATLDRMGEAVAVFDMSGMLVFVNSSFEQLWGLEPMENLEGPGVSDMTQLWASRCAPSPVWANLAEFATAAEARTSWTATVEMRDGRRLHVLVAPLPDASALVVFRDLSSEHLEQVESQAQVDRQQAARENHALTEEIMVEQLRIPVEAALKQIKAAIPSAQTPEAFQMLNGAVQTLKDSLSRAQELEAASVGHDAAMFSELAPLRRLLSGRRIALNVEGPLRPIDGLSRRAAWAAALALADIAQDGARIEIRFTEDEGALRAIASAPAVSRAETIGQSVARKVLESAGGSLVIAYDPGRVTITAELPKAAGGDALQRGLAALS